MGIIEPSRSGLAQEMARALDASTSFAAVLCRPTPGQGWRVREATPGFWRAIGRAPMPQAELAVEALLADGVADDMLHALDERRELAGELPFAAPDGRRLWFGVNLLPSAADSVVLFGRDVTAQRTERLERRASEELLVAVFLRVDAAVAIVDAGSILLMANPPMEALFGFPPGGIVGSVTLDRIDPADRAAIVSARDRQLRDGTPYSLSITCLRRDGSPFAVTWSSRVAQARDHSRFRIITVRPREAAPLPAGPPVLVAGKIQLIGLDAIRASLGERWGSLAERAMASAEHVLARRLGASDTFSRTTDCGFVVCFHDTTEEEAGFRAAAIAGEIRTRLLGAETAAAVSVVVAQEDAALPQALEQRLEARRCALQDRARGILAQATTELRCEAHKVISRSGKPSNLVSLALLDDVRRQLLAAAAMLPEAEAPPLSAMSLTAAIERAGEEMLGGSREHFIVELGPDLLLQRGREAMLAVARRVEAGLRRRLILLLPPEPPGLLSDIVRDLRDIGFDPAWTIEELPLSPRHPAAQQRSMVAADAAFLTRSLQGGEDALPALLSALKRTGGILWACDVRDRETANALRMLGVGLMSLCGPRR